MASSRRDLVPAFGQADLSNCEREQIQLAGSIQPHGALLLVREPEYLIVQSSANAAAFLNSPDEILQRPLASLDGDIFERIEPYLKEPLHRLPISVRCSIGSSDQKCDCLLHRPPDGGLIIELEEAGRSVDFQTQIEEAIQAISTAISLQVLCDETAKLFKKLTGYDRVMVYRFDEEGHGEVFSERREPELEAFLGNRYPSSDIPQIARRLYERNRVRVLVDVDYEPVPLSPRLSPLTGKDLDMSMCFLRSMSPIHIQYLQNMGVGATLVASLMVGGRLWGLISCHHYVPRHMHYEARLACELLAEAIATRIAALESFTQAQAELSVRRLEQRLVEAISREGDWRAALFDNNQSLLQPLNATGAALLFEDQILSSGEVPGTHKVREIAAWLSEISQETVISTASLGIDQPQFEVLKPVASGIVAARVSNSPGEYLIWFRPERLKQVTWGGDPNKPMIIGDDPRDLSPRRSFAQWHQVVEKTSDPWTQADLTTARLIADTVKDVVLQFRSVRVLIAQDQLEQVRQHVMQSDDPVIVADQNGRILLGNEAFEQLLPKPHTHLHYIDDLPPLFSDPGEARERLQELLHDRQAWRGEMLLENASGEKKPLLVRADPVYSSPDRILGFVLLFADLTERKSMMAARNRFQQAMVESQRSMTNRLDDQSEAVYQTLLSSLVGNAHLAALEITDGLDLARMPEMLDSVQSSVSRSSELLEHLIWHSSNNDEKDA